jgi:predicted nucleotidyltransferase
MGLCAILEFMVELHQSKAAYLSEVTARIVQTAKPKRIILFGSAARGSTNPDSDLDLLVIVNDPVHRRFLAQKIYRSLHGIGLPIDIIVATQSDLDTQSDRPGSIFKSALEEGQIVYEST